MTGLHCLVCGHPIAAHTDPPDHLDSPASVQIHGCHIRTEP